MEIVIFWTKLGGNSKNQKMNDIKGPGTMSTPVLNRDQSLNVEDRKLKRIIVS